MKTSHSLTITPGSPTLFGATPTATGINFAVAAKDAQHLSLCLFEEQHPPSLMCELPLDPILHRTGHIWHIHVAGLPSHFLYGYRASSFADEHPKLLLDPYAKLLFSHSRWGESGQPNYCPLGKVAPPPPFDWQGDRPLERPMKELIIYEMHIRGFTQHPSSQTESAGTFLGVIEKIPHLLALGVNAVEILPVHEFNEEEVRRFQLDTDENLTNYFGYSTVSFFSLMNRYAGDSHPVYAFKTMVRELHKAGIEVLLDVVYNHTCEGNASGPTLSFRGLDKHAYYLLDEKGGDLNYSGCGNTLNANHPLTRKLIFDSLHYFVTEMHVDGFRFDLASIFSRGQTGAVLAAASLVEALAQDSLLAHTKLIAEAWDAAGLYQVGHFYPGKRWSEWNGHFRDIVRRFINGTPHLKGRFATALCGSQDLYGWGGRSPTCSINFVTAHDGFSLRDLVSYNAKHNLSNGENNRDGSDQNDSWNCGEEGETDNKKILALRNRQMRNFITALMVSQGVPMVVMGDEYGHTRLGNNNPWCQDNILNWFLWDELEAQEGFFRFFRSMIHFRKRHSFLSRDRFLESADIAWHGLNPLKPEWDVDNHFVAFTLNDKGSPLLYIAFNAASVGQTVHIPPPAPHRHWEWVVNTFNPSPEDFYDEGSRPLVTSLTYHMPSYSAIILKTSSS